MNRVEVHCVWVSAGPWTVLAWERAIVAPCRTGLLTVSPWERAITAPHKTDQNAGCYRKGHDPGKTVILSSGNLEMGW